MMIGFEFRRLIWIRVACGFLGAWTWLAGPGDGTAADPSQGKVDFQREVRPILSHICFKCHGPDDNARKANLRLDVREAAIAPAKSSKIPIVPGRADQSELVRRIFSSDPDDLMPPPESKMALASGQKTILRKWVAAGAEYTPHWAFVAPHKSPLPAVQDASWPRNAIDYFVLARLEKEGLKPSPEADRYELARRVYLDLIGLPPTPEEVEAFLKDQGPRAYETLVDRLLASPHYGERWARRWLDLARYADTNGYEKDRRRSIWPYRDWVINALNADMPFNQFTVEQLAGDMLPNAGVSDRIATGFHRNTMLNEEGGIDPLEFRFYAMVDRVATTATTWLGLTLQCAQCHSHKYDPIPHREYYQFMAFLNNADEPSMPVPDPDVAAKRAKIEEEINRLEAELPAQFPVDEVTWKPVRPIGVESAEGASPQVRPDDSVLFSGPTPDQDTYTIEFESDRSDATELRLEALTDRSLPSQGPGRTPHGNFVLSEVTVAVAPSEGKEPARQVKIVGATADHSQEGFAVEKAVDGNLKTGWAIDGAKPLNQNRTARFRFAQPSGWAGGGRWTVRLEQRHGSKHTLGRIRLSLGYPMADARPLEVRRREKLEAAFAAWLDRETKRTARWTALEPLEAKSNLPLLTVQDDRSIFVSGDMTKRDLYQVKLKAGMKGIRALRLEVLPDERLPNHGPGRVFYEGPPGEFFLSELTVLADGKPVKMASADHSFAADGFKAAAAIDGDPQTGWGINGGQGRAHSAVFRLAEPLGEVATLDVHLLFERYYAAGLGRFRISVATDERPAEAREMPFALEPVLLSPPSERTEEQRQALMRQFLSVTPELAGAREKIEQLRREMPSFPTTLVMQERPPQNPRPTYVHHRGEFLHVEDQVQPAALSALHPWPKGAARNRLNFARWLVDPANPLIGRVTVNRAWAAFFGRGIVRTVEDFGTQGDVPSHPKLLDWLAVDFIEQGWSLKKLHRLIVTSATYRQSSSVSAELAARDLDNRLLARGPRTRLEAELVRDNILRAAGLLSEKIGGPSVFPPQPPGVTTEGAYGRLDWKVSEGADRYRRGLYTFSKRTTPYAMFLTFDASSGERCLARREVSNSPLQALTLLNDTVFVEASQALGRMLAAADGSVSDRIRILFRRCLVRPPEKEETRMLETFYEAQRKRFAGGDLDCAKVAGAGKGDLVERAAWTAVARAVLNLDETITKG
jgi:Protein of unknown function (DUF1553)/Protein of unknown function (DUF1549)/Planctomycete cytochrome C